MIKMTGHAKARQMRYGLNQAWIDATILSPDWTKPDPLQPGVTRSFRAIPERGRKILRVAHRNDGADLLVLSAFFDRGAKL